ncbi:hypothetical protein, unknown function [Leishmania mexicana MHOM/GT/2001/U1103]|uniref:Uncharacterized protein n=1 Tax=Leishmania mexicana (strain MHOM/GT/2001/U1103) TaxID=929439 RepID=E9AJ87_LEIMU|nr:hypothetical protein, unknown function [Leishmania mexicana MHOM/GT/2001/U1103]CBZ22984.1 hypothetical protein, unknown function [Leishmania mexicana MHOM/GT/2001/U1103]
MRCALVFVLVVAVLACFAPAMTHAYSTTYTARSAGSGGAFAFDPLEIDFCKLHDSASHTAMSTSAFIQEALQSAYQREGISGNIPLGGMTEQAVCTGTQCEWRWYRGLFRTTRPLFLRGVNFWGAKDDSAPVDKTTAVSGSYTNFETNYPRSWGNLSYWGKRLVVMQSSGKWVNTEVSTSFTNFLCEYYVYADSDGVNRLVPTFPGGSAIPLVSSSGHTYTYCGKKVEVDSQSRWILPKCNETFPWWGSLIIAVVLYIILIALIISIWCCCCIRRRNKEEKRRRNIIGSQYDNQGAIPTQSELGLSRHNSFRGTSMYSSNDDSDSDADAYSSRA